MIKDIHRQIHRALSNIRHAFRGLIITATSASPVSLLQISGMSGEILHNVELFQQFGFSSNPPSGSQAIILPLGGHSAQGVIVATENGSYRIRALASGEVAIYSQFGDSIKLSTEGILFTSTRNLVVDAPDLIVNNISVVSHLHGNVQSGTSNTSAPLP